LSQEVQKPSYSLSAYGRLLRDNRNFRLLWFAQVISELGDWLYAVAIYSLLLEITGKASSVGIAVVLQLLPQVMIAPLAGVLNDRLSRRSVMIFADLVRVFIVLAMLLVRDASTVWLIWVLLFLETVMWALFEPGRSAIIPNITRNDDELLVANALSSTTWAFNLAIGSGIGGLIAYKFGRDAVFVLNSLSFVISAALLAALKINETHHKHLPQMRPAEMFGLAPVLEGVRYVRQDPRLLATMFVKAGMGLLGAHWVILPIYGERVFPLVGHGLDPAHSGTLSMSLLLGSRGIGALLGSFASGYWAGNQDSRLRSGILWGFVIVSLAYVALSFAPSLALACLAVTVGHAGTATNWVFSTTMLQKLTIDRFRGRVFSADFSGLFLVMSVVSLAAGLLVDQGVPIRHIALWTGLLGALPAALWIWAQKYWRDTTRSGGLE
jgi:predicted MFS family arabinose efflux permease